MAFWICYVFFLIIFFFKRDNFRKNIFDVKCVSRLSVQVYEKTAWFHEESKNVLVPLCKAYVTFGRFWQNFNSVDTFQENIPGTKCHEDSSGGCRLSLYGRMDRGQEDRHDEADCRFLQFWTLPWSHKAPFFCSFGHSVIAQHNTTLFALLDTPVIAQGTIFLQFWTLPWSHNTTQHNTFCTSGHSRYRTRHHFFAVLDTPVIAQHNTTLFALLDTPVIAQHNTFCTSGHARYRTRDHSTQLHNINAK
jgi:hypothetical protein